MDVFKIEVDQVAYNQIRESKIKHSLKYVEVTGVDYSGDEKWTALKSASTKAYKALKKREFELRHKNSRK